MCNDNHTHRHLFPSPSGRGVRGEGRLLEKGPKAQRGASLIMVLFLLVVVSLLVAAMARLNEGGSNAVSMEIQSTRALFAAESGAQSAAMRLFPIGGAAPGCAAVTATPPIAFPAGGLGNCSATLTCNSVVVGNRTVYTVTSEGRCAVDTDDFARRRVTVGLWNLQ